MPCGIPCRGISCRVGYHAVWDTMPSHLVGGACACVLCCAGWQRELSLRIDAVRNDGEERAALSTRVARYKEQDRLVAAAAKCVPRGPPARARAALQLCRIHTCAPAARSQRDSRPIARACASSWARSGALRRAARLRRRTALLRMEYTAQPAPCHGRPRRWLRAAWAASRLHGGDAAVRGMLYAYQAESG
jgi:hypothetical protein